MWASWVSLPLAGLRPLHPHHSTLGRTVPQLKVPQAALTIGNSSDILRYLHGREAHRPAREAFLRLVTFLLFFFPFP